MAKKVIVFATGNQHKVEEVSQILGENYEIKSLKDINFFDEIPETGVTFEENALQKAAFIKEKFGMDCLAEDSGLVVDGLNGEPGIYSARYAGSQRNDEENLQKVLKELGDNPIRSARYKSVIALVLNGENHFFEGTVEGEILKGKVGNGGFGYDPIFQPKGYEISFGEMDAAEKNKISHRGEAVEKMVSFLNKKNQ